MTFLLLLSPLPKFVIFVSLPLMLIHIAVLSWKYTYASPLRSSPLLSSLLLLSSVVLSPPLCGHLCLSFFFTYLPSLSLQKPINLPAELRACVLFSFFRGSGHMSVCLLVCLLALTAKCASVCICACVSVCVLLICVFAFAHLQVNTRPNPANDCTHAVPDSMANNRWVCWGVRSILHYLE